MAAYLLMIKEFTFFPLLGRFVVAAAMEEEVAGSDTTIHRARATITPQRGASRVAETAAKRKQPQTKYSRNNAHISSNKFTLVVLNTCTLYEQHQA